MLPVTQLHAAVLHQRQIAGGLAGLRFEGSRRPEAAPEAAFPAAVVPAGFSVAAVIIAAVFAYVFAAAAFICIIIHAVVFNSAVKMAQPCGDPQTSV